MNDIKFNNIKELYDRLTPALKSKKDELSRLGFTYIRLEDIWNFLKMKKWSNAYNLLLYQMVDDIVSADPLEIDAFYKDNLASIKE